MDASTVSTWRIKAKATYCEGKSLPICDGLLMKTEIPCEIKEGCERQS